MWYDLMLNSIFSSKSLKISKNRGIAVTITADGQLWHENKNYLREHVRLSLVPGLWAQLSLSFHMLMDPTRQLRYGPPITQLPKSMCKISSKLYAMALHMTVWTK